MNIDWEHITERLKSHRRVLQVLELKRAQYGINLPPEDVIAIEDHREEIARLERMLGVAEQSQEVLHFLPHLADRNAQKDSLSDVLRRLDRLSPKPVVCLFHGDESQAQDMFIERLKKYIFPEVLGLSKDLSIMEYALLWPDRYSAAASFHDFLLRRIAEALQEYDDITLASLNARLSASIAPTLFSTFVSTQDWERHGIEGLRTFLRFWQRWSPLNPDQLLIICIFITYEFKRGSGFFGRWRSQRSNTSLMEAVQTLAHEPIDGIIYSVLPRLEGVERRDAEYWARSTETRHICPRDEIIDGIRTIYETWEKNERSSTIPMEVLAKELRALLGKYIGQGREFV